MILSRLRVRRLRPLLTVGCRGSSHVRPFLLEGAAGRAQLLPLSSQNHSLFALGTSRLEQRFFSSQAVDDDVSLPPAAKRESPIVETTVEEQYSRKTPLEHVLLRPGMYVGPNERLPPSPCWVLDKTPPLPSTELLMNPAAAETTTTTLPPFRMVQREYGVVPALIKIFDEILVNASDNRLRHPAGKSGACTRIDVIIDPGSSDRDPFIRICNDGKGIPIQIHKHENMYVPEMLFGHLLTGSNFDDNQKRLTGGRHGYGAKLTNIFSKSFTVETVDARKKLMYRQTWSNNMQQVVAPEITKLSAQDGGSANAHGNAAMKDYTAVSFVPDLPRLTGENDPGNPSSFRIAPEEYAIMCRRVVDVAGCAAGKLQVTLNGHDVSMPSFLTYSEAYRKADAPPLCFQAINARWMVGVGLSDSGSFESMSFVNGMATDRGGTHVNAVVQQVTKRIVEKVEKIDAELGRLVSQGLVRRHLFVSCDALIENPTFDSQMKEYLTSSPTSFGSSCALSEKLLNSLLKSEDEGGPGIVEEVLRVARGRQQASLFKGVGGKKTRRQLLSIPKLEDAHKAGSESGWDCTLILTEGDSAKALAVAGLEVIGRERFGVFPLRGKFLNVREATVSQLTKNAEVKALTAIMGLDFDKVYDTVAERRDLRYGRVMLMTDQDTDGSHIKGLVMNFFRHFWPKLLQPPVDQPPEEAGENPPFLASFVTPLLKATMKGKKEALSFYSMAEYNEWRESMDVEDVKKWKVKYYKGLGTSTPAEAKEYFSAFENHFRPFHWNSEIDGELLDMIFDKKRAADRRHWILNEYDEKANVVVDPARGNVVSYEDFVNKEMIHFSHADNIRSIPNVIDGLKPSQRKVLYACFKRNLKSEVKVAQLTGYCAEHTAYHHGEVSLQSTIIGMAQDFVGSNNINMLVPSGQFGTRLAGGADAASPRYIFTHLAPIARGLFPEVDDALLTQREDDGQMIEPEFYCPVIPLLLVNGSQGIGTGWSTFIPPHNPHDVLDYIRAKLDGAEDMPPIRPFARGFNGSIEALSDATGYVTRGKASRLNDKTVTIGELPLRCWTNSYKEQLLKMRDHGDISSFVENHTTSKVSFTVQLQAAKLTRMIRSGLEKAFKLETNLKTTNMNAFDENYQMRKFDSAESIADAFFPLRLALYHDRKSVLESEMNYDAAVLRNKAQFIQAVTSGEVDLMSGRKTKEQTTASLQDLGLTRSTDLKVIRDNNALAKRRRAEGDIDGITDLKDVPLSSEYDYLLNMPLSSLTSEKIADLQKEASKKEQDFEQLQRTSPEELWRTDLDKLAALL